jgi:cobalt-precorrin-7 (C5)-methyltransferase
MTPAAREAVAAAEALVGGSAISSSSRFRRRTLCAGPIFRRCWRGLRRAGRRVVVLASGDPLFYGIGTRLMAHFGIERVRIIPGISAVQYLCARAGIDMNDIWLTSSHGRA